METFLIQSIPRDNNLMPVIIALQSPSGYRPATVADFASNGSSGNINIDSVGVTGVVQINDSQPTGAAINAIAATNTGQMLLLDNNSSRKCGTIFNNSSSLMFVGYGSVSLDLFSFVIPASGFYEIPKGYFAGQIFGIWNGSGGSGLVTELTV